MDRLTTLVERFHLSVRPAPLGRANLIACAKDGATPERVVFFARATEPRSCAEAVLFAASVDWAGASNPLLASLPDKVELDLRPHPETAALVGLMHHEAVANRCGAQSVINRLGEALMVRLLRDQIERGSTEAGLLAGMADPRLSRAIVSMHDHPGRLWTNADLAQIAGLSLSRFCELFAGVVGETPMGYLRRWRLILARQDVMNGDRIERVAHRYAYASPESFTRAFRKAYGTAPSRLRPAPSSSL
ncbi:AraC family transcriptional regulator [Shimia sp. SDUM112013]|uniref:AraC family transcriptional regulator n=1 Tax=Shimia sp. SDUM112013 TaxID=3136160 RepID=UPI0032ED0054